MKKITTLVHLILLTISVSFCQPRFNRIYRMFTVDSTGQQAATTFSSMRVVGNNIYTAGVGVRIVDSVITNSGIFSSFDMSGNMLKNTYFGVIPTNSDFDDDVILVEPNNQFSLIGYNFEHNFTFWKVDKDGNILIKRTYRSSDTAYWLGTPPNCVKINNKYFFASHAAYSGFTKLLFYVIDTFGNKINNVQFSSSEKTSVTKQIIKNKNNGLTICSYNTSNSSTDTTYIYTSQLCEVDTSGNTLWIYNTSVNRYIYFKQVIQLANGNYLAWGDEELSKNGRLYREVTLVRPYMAEINPQRGLIWERRFDLNTSSRMFGFKILKDSCMILACSFSDGSGNTSACLIKLNKNRDSLFRRNFRATSITSGNILHIPNQIEELDNGDLVIGGWAQDLKNRTLSVTSGQWGWLVRTDSLGCSLEPSSCRTPTKDIKEYPLSILAYPNPTSGSLTIDFDIQASFKAAHFSLIDITGREVLHQKIDNGQKQLVWQTEQLNQGLYFVILKVDGQIVYQNKVSVQK